MPVSAAGYEDWYLLDDWTAIGVLEEAAVSRGHLGAHEAIAALARLARRRVYRLIEGHAQPRGGVACIWVGPSRARRGTSGVVELAALLGDGMDPASGGPLAPLPRARPGARVLPAARTEPPTAGVAPDRGCRGLECAVSASARCCWNG